MSSVHGYGQDKKFLNIIYFSGNLRELQCGHPCYTATPNVRLISEQRIGNNVEGLCRSTIWNTILLLISKETEEDHEDVKTVDVTLESEVLKLETNRSTGDEISTYNHVNIAYIFGTKMGHVNRMWRHTDISTEAFRVAHCVSTNSRTVCYLSCLSSQANSDHVANALASTCERM